MKKFITMILSIFITLTVCLSSVMPVYAADTARNTTSYSTTSIAYAVFNPDTGEMDFIRSEENHDNGKTGTVKSISGGTYNGTIYSGFEEEHYGYYPIRPILGCAPWLNIAKNVKTIKTIDPIKPDSISCWFYKMTNCTSMDLTNLDTSNVTSMNAIFKDCSSLISLDISNWDTSKVKDMSLMFDGCSSLKSLDVGSFDTSNTTKMEWMFNKCNSLISLDVSHFDTSNVTDMSHMFDGCSSLKSLNVGSFDTSNVTNMGYMFYNCNSLTSLDVSKFDTSNVTNMSNMFYGCNSLTSLNLSNFDTSNVTDLSLMFSSAISKITFGDKYKIPSDLPSNVVPVFSSPSKTISGKVSCSLWGLNSETAEKKYSAKELTEYGKTARALTGTWYAQIDNITAYAVFNSDTGELDFINSDEIHTNNTKGTIKSVSGKSYTGTIFTGFDDNVKSQKAPWASYADKIKTVKCTGLKECLTVLR